METDKLVEITGRIKAAGEELKKASKPDRDHNSALGTFIAVLTIPFLMLIFMATIVFAVWLIMNPMNLTTMYGVSIALIGCYVAFLNPKRKE